MPIVEVGDISHEVRTPLAYLQNSAILLRRRLDALAAGRAQASDVLPVAEECVRQIEEAVDRIDRVVRREAHARRQR